MKDFIATSIRNIREAKDSGRLVVFVGSGVSMNSGMPSWYRIIDEMAKDLGMDKDKNNKKRAYSSDEFLTIPQIYYNQRGSTEYFRRIGGLFPPAAVTNAIHKLLFDLEPAHIITTNYDNLLEQQMHQGDVPYHVVTQDMDLPFAQYPRMIIKMHGDLGIHNMVLKENDYLSYTQEFKLIDNVVKSLFATNLILFVGFSATDPNFKLIYQWVKDALKGNILPAYLIQTADDYDQNQFEYFNSKGIRILYFNEIEEEVRGYTGSASYTDDRQKLDSDVGRKLYDFLAYLLNQKISQRDLLECVTLDEVIETVYNDLVIYRDFRALMPEHILTAIDKRQRGLRLRYDEIFIGDRDLAMQLLQLNSYTAVRRLLENNGMKLRYIYDILGRAQIVRIVSVVSDANFAYTIRVKPTAIKNIEFDFLDSFKLLSLEEYIEKNPLTEISKDNEMHALQRACVLFDLGRPIDAWHLLRMVSSYAFNARKDWLWFISIFNRTSIARLLWRNMFYYRRLEFNELQEMRDEVDLIALSDQFSRRQKQERELYDFISNIDSAYFLMEVRDEINSILQEARKAKRLADNGGFSFADPPLARKAQFHLETLESFARENGIAIRYSSFAREIYSSFCRIQYTAYMTIDREERDGRLRRREIEKVDYRTFHCSIVYVDPEDLKEMLDDLAIQTISSDDQVITEIVAAFVNLIKFVATVNWRERLFFFEHYLYNFLTILSRLILTAEQYDRIYEQLSEYVYHRGVERKWIRYLNRLVLVHYHYGVRYGESLEGLLTRFLERVIASGSELLEEGISEVFIFNIVRLLRKDDPNYKVTANRVISTVVNSVIAGWTKSPSEKSIKLMGVVLIPLYPIVSNDAQKQIRYFAKSRLSIESGENAVEIFYHSVTRGLIKVNGSLLKDYLRNLGNHIAAFDFASDSERKRILRELEQLAKLIERGLVLPSQINLDRKMISRISARLDFSMNPSRFDYRKFNIQWLVEFPDSLMVRLGGNRSSRKKILLRYRSEVQDGDVDSKISTAIANYFI